MSPEIRRIVAVAAHRRRAGECPVLIYSLGTGESFQIKPLPDGFVDLETGLNVRVNEGQIVLPDTRQTVDLNLTGDVAFDGYDHTSREHFSGRAGGGASVTIYDAHRADYFQYAVFAEGSRQ